ncbi:hypothetical protein GcM3_022027 [Golovinomyces cichoracearum]|uniref:Uncharacterized protein n=1 Tax=Golovinomyces cichoracearum TaxID=62708 RepID=A0A420J777_9PEZI|nr:hypothetical protein GcM3_022027 [Golovinomyces cichoracearum]
MSRNFKSRFNPHVIRAQKEAADQQRREDDQKRRDEEFIEALHRKKLREAGDRSAAPTLPATTSVTQDNFSYQNRLEPTPLTSAPPTISTDPNPNFQPAEPVDYSKVTTELRTRERNVQQAMFDSQNQGRQSEDTEESENARLRYASANRERNSRIGHRSTVSSNTDHFQQTTEPKSQPELQQIVPACERSRAGPPSDRRMLTELAKVYTPDNIKYGGDMYDPLDSKLLIFEDWCNKLNIISDDRDHAFSIILKGRTQEYY